MSGTYREGQRLRMRVNGVVRKIDGVLRFVYNDDAVGMTIESLLEKPTLTFEHLAPAEWPPVPGDKWRDGKDCQWFAVMHRGRLDLVNTNGYMADDDLDAMLQDRAPWMLVHPSDERGEQ